MLRSVSSTLSREPRRLVTSVVAATAALLLLTGCTGQPAEDTRTTPTAEPSATAEPAPAGPALVPEGSAEDNLPFFQSIVAQVWASEQRVSSRAYVDALTAAGFNRADMQVTKDISTVEYPAESILFSVRWGTDQCLMGQVGPSTGDQPVTAVMPQLAEGRCLVGDTMPIDW